MRWLSLSVDVLRKGVSLNLYCRRIRSPRFSFPSILHFVFISWFCCSCPFLVLSFWVLW
ncbi:unnamed protein product [Musa acuminata var. zebrina]